MRSLISLAQFIRYGLKDLSRIKMIIEGAARQAACNDEIVNRPGLGPFSENTRMRRR